MTEWLVTLECGNLEAITSKVEIQTKGNSVGRPPSRLLPVLISKITILTVLASSLPKSQGRSGTKRGNDRRYLHR